MKNTIVTVLEKLENSNYFDPAEHLYDAIKGIKRHLNDDNIDLYVNDFLWGIESSTIGDFDGVVKECIALIKSMQALTNTKKTQEPGTIENDMENFFYNSVFCSDLSDLMDELDIDEENLNELEEDWFGICESSTLEKIFVIKKEFAVDSIMASTENWVDRFPENSDITEKEIKKAISDAVDIDKLNDGLPSFYYPNGKEFKVTKADLAKWCS